MYHCRLSLCTVSSSQPFLLSLSVSCWIRTSTLIQSSPKYNVENYLGIQAAGTKEHELNPLKPWARSTLSSFNLFSPRYLSGWQKTDSHHLSKRSCSLVVKTWALVSNYEPKAGNCKYPVCWPGNKSSNSRKSLQWVMRSK